MLRQIGVAGFHTSAEPVVSHRFIGITQQVHTSVCVTEIQILDGDNGGENGIRMGRTGDLGHVSCSGILIGVRKAVWIDEVGGGHAEFLCLGIHDNGEFLDGTCVVASKCTGNIVRALDEQSRQEFTTSVGSSGSELKFCRFGGFVNRLNHDGLIEIAVFCNKQGGEQFLSAPNGTFLIGVDL